MVTIERHQVESSQRLNRLFLFAAADHRLHATEQRWRWRQQPKPRGSDGTAASASAASASAAAALSSGEREQCEGEEHDQYAWVSDGHEAEHSLRHGGQAADDDPVMCRRAVRPSQIS